MAKIRPTSPFEDIRGRVGGLVYSSNRAGSYVKSLSVPPRQPTQPQQASQSELTRVVQLWRTLAEETREAWDAYALEPENARTDYWGNPFFISGLNWFTIIQRYALYLGATLPVSVPALPPPQQPPAMLVRIDPMQTAGGSMIDSIGAWEYPGAPAWVGLSIWPSLGQRFPSPNIRRLIIWENIDLDRVDWDAEIVRAFGRQQGIGRWFVRIYALTPEYRPGPWRDFTAALGETIEEEI